MSRRITSIWLTFLYSLRDQSYHIEPFIMPSERELGLRQTGTDSPVGTLVDGTHTTNPSLSHSADRSRSPTGSAFSPTSAAPMRANSPLPSPRPLSSENRTPSQVFVVHHDGGRPPVTVYAADGTEIVELPPRYIESNGSSPGPSTSSNPSVRSGPVPPLQIQERRESGPIPPKQRRVIN